MPRLRQQPLPDRSQPDATMLTHEHGTGKVFEPRDLLADGALRQVKGVAGRSHARVVGDGDERSQERDIEVADHAAIRLRGAGCAQHAFH